MSRGGKIGSRRTPEQKRRMIQVQLAAKGQTNCGDEILDYYLAGFGLREIAEAFGISDGAVMRRVKTLALIRLLEQNHSEKLSEIIETEKDL